MGYSTTALDFGLHGTLHGTKDRSGQRNGTVKNMGSGLIYFGDRNPFCSEPLPPAQRGSPATSAPSQIVKLDRKSGRAGGAQRMGVGGGVDGLVSEGHAIPREVLSFAVGGRCVD
jgi:hypothetical protein